MNFETVCTSYIRLVFGTGVGANGVVIPENPNRAITQFGGSSFQGNNSMSKYVTLYDEMRVKAIIVEFQPNNVGFPSGSSIAFVGLCDYDSELSAGVLTTELSAVQYTTARVLGLNAEHQLIYQPTMNRSFPTWFTTVDTSARGCVYYFISSNASGAVGLGTVVVKYILEFRNMTA